ncbi:hypothetical protein PR048_016338 [Dryococelus australis]|uniref:Uncharacterized protein n=1 Tax=Dryococelus australis TaxID=614101 RepID=A0ABQ9HK11_9NEOP|nr:hypothetical protein PR048_016338 [Dryococelus australis]
MNEVLFNFVALLAKNFCCCYFYRNNQRKEKETGKNVVEEARMFSVGFKCILKLVAFIIAKQHTNCRDNIPASKRLAITCIFLAFFDKVIMWLKLAQNFWTKGNFPHCLGALVGKHIWLQCPAICRSNFFNYNCIFSLILIAVGDANYCFWYVNIGCQDRILYGGVFENANFHEQLQQNQLKIPPSHPLIGRENPCQFVLVADDVFLLTCNIQKPYAGNLALSTERIFNYRLSRA